MLIQCRVSLGSLVCDSCQYCTALLHNTLAETSDMDVDGLISRALSKTSQPDLPHLQSLTETERKDRCQRNYAADRYILRRFLRNGGFLDRSQMARELCLQRLRCAAGDLRLEDAKPSMSHPTPTTYEEMLATYSKVAGTWPPAPVTAVPEQSEAASEGESCDTVPEISTNTEPQTRQTAPEDPLSPECTSKKDSYDDLSSTRVVVVIFTGRRDRLRILLRYLRRDLRSAGGVVDKVIFALWQLTSKDWSYIQEQLQGSDGAVFEVRDFTEDRWGSSQCKTETR